LTPLPYTELEISALRRDRQHAAVDILVAVTCIIRGWSRCRVEITGRNIPMICPGDIDSMIRACPACIQFYVVSVEACRTAAEQETIPVMGHVTHSHIFAEGWVCKTGMIRCAVASVA